MIVSDDELKYLDDDKQVEIVFTHDNQWAGPDGKEGISRVQFKGYSQEQRALMGAAIDWHLTFEDLQDDCDQQTEKPED